MRKTFSRKTAILTLRILIGGTFICSGFVKGIDIWGVEYKIEDYLNALGWSWAYPFAGFAAFALPLYEFVLGVLLLVGSFRKVTVALLLAGMAFMLPLSFYIWMTDPVSDCGCFGDAFILSNSATFLKNVLITGGLVFLYLRNKQLRSFFGPAVQWLTAVIPAAYLLVVIAYGYFVQPMMDFRPYKIGTGLSELQGDDGEGEFAFIYEKDGERREFTVDALPDTTWTFVDRREIPQSGKPDDNHPDVNPLSVFDGEESASGVISGNGITLLLLIPDISATNALTDFRLNDLYDLSSEKGISMICLTSSSDKDIAAWREIALSTYPVYRMDDSQLKSVARGNPAIVCLKDGIIEYKSTLRAFFSLTGTETEMAGLQEMQAESGSALHILTSLTLVMAALMSALLLANRAPLFITRYKKAKFAGPQKSPTVKEEK